MYEGYRQANVREIGYPGLLGRPLGYMGCDSRPGKEDRWVDVELPWLQLSVVQAGLGGSSRWPEARCLCFKPDSPSGR